MRLNDAESNAPPVRFRVFILDDKDRTSQQVIGEWEDQIKEFFRLSPATDVECQITE